MALESQSDESLQSLYWVLGQRTVDQRSARWSVDADAGELCSVLVEAELTRRGVPLPSAPPRMDHGY